MGAIRAVLLTPGLWQPGGAERWVYSLIANSDPRQLEWQAVVLGGYGGADVELTRAISRHCKIYGEHPSVQRAPEAACLMDTNYVSLVDALKKACIGADVLVTWGSAGLGRFIKHTGFDIPVVYASHCSTKWQHDVDGITHLVGVSEMAMQHFEGNDGFVGLPREVILNGVEVERCVPRRGREWQRQQWGVADDDILVGHIGRQSPTKKPEALVSTVKVLQDQSTERDADNRKRHREGWPRYKAVFVGADVQTQAPAKYLVDMARSQIPDNSIFVPTVSGVGDVLAGLDCVFSASPAEANSLVVLEAFLAGVPVVSTPVGAIPELTKAKGQLTFQIEDPANFVAIAGLVGLATSKTPLVREQVNRARAIAWDEWTAPAMAQRWTDYLATVIRRPIYRQLELFRQW